MADKEYVKDLGAGAATAMRLTSPWRNCGRRQQRLWQV